MSTRPHVLALSLALGLAAACYDPVHADDVAALGPEAAGVRRGPLHRPGQRCTTCHGDSGPGAPEFSIAGTVYAVRGQPAPMEGVSVTITDATGSTKVLTSNAVGSFYATTKEWAPVFPLRVALDFQGTHREMTSTIGRDGGCATCHRGVGDPNFAPAIFLNGK